MMNRKAWHRMVRQVEVKKAIPKPKEMTWDVVLDLANDGQEHHEGSNKLTAEGASTVGHRRWPRAGGHNSRSLLFISYRFCRMEGAGANLGVVEGWAIPTPFYTSATCFAVLHIAARHDSLIIFNVGPLVLSPGGALALPPPATLRARPCRVCSLRRCSFALTP